MTDITRLQTRRHVERVLRPWRDAAIPGMTIGVVRDGELVAHGCAGLASLELGVPIGPATAFRIASVSKQFTTAAVLMLAADGRLQLDDDAAMHLPELAQLGRRVTVAQLMHNTSGIRDMLELMRLGGADLGTPVTAAQILEAIARQRATNFAPGSRYLYSNSNFLLLGLIVERISGQSLPEFLRGRIFEPLGMTATRMTPSTLDVVANLATGYLPAEGGFWRRAPHAFPLGGEGGLVSSVEDLALWACTAEAGLPGGAALLAELERIAPFPDGTPNGYARGLQVGSYRGLRTVSHGGLWPGYKTQFLRIPERRLAIIAISNNGASDPYHAAQDVLDALIEATPGVHAVPPSPPPADLARYVGTWLDRATGQTVDFALEQGVLMGRTWGVPFRAVPSADGRLIASRATSDFACRLDGDRLEVEADAGIRATFERAPAQAALPSDLPGRYASEEMEAVWTIARLHVDLVHKDVMRVRIDGPVARGAEMVVRPIDGDLVRIVSARVLFEAWMDTRVERDAQGRIVALHVDGGRVRGVRFARLREGETMRRTERERLPEPA
ncbi:MAG: beta-lactamase family protein [Acetobacteraceae bacterium]|nr:beta-lactamase family protein [Acetobacteraceae bacterium]